MSDVTSGEPTLSESPPSESTSSEPTPSVEITRLLARWQDDPRAREEVVELVYDHLRRLARWRLRHRRPGATLQVTELVHETYLRLARQSRVEWQNRSHFFAVAAQAMRRIVLDRARRQRAARRIPPDHQQAFDTVPEVAITRVDGLSPVDLLALDQALTRLAAIDARQARLVELRFFAGLSIHDTAVVLQASPATVKRDWQLAQAWLRREMGSRR